MNDAAVMRLERAVLPWADAGGEDRRFRRITLAVLCAVIAVALIVPYLQVAKVAPPPLADNAARLARMLEERAVPPPPPLPSPSEEPLPPDMPLVPATPEPPPVTAEQPPPPPRAPETAPPVETAPAVEPARAVARERAQRSGLLALSQELAELRTDAPTRTLQSQQLITTTASAPDAPPERAAVTARSGVASGGIDDALPTAREATQLAGRETTRVDAPVESGSMVGSTSTAPARPSLPSRTSDEIQRVFDQNRAALNTLYSRALRNNPTLAGTVVLRLVILPSGDVAECEIVSSQLGDAELERRLVARVRQFDFGARNVSVTEITYPIDFFPG